MMHIYLYGPPGSGKSTVGKYLAGKVKLPFFDLDDEIEKESGTSITELMAVSENHFRDIESRMLSEMASRESSVVALGGGALLREENRRCAEDSGEVVLLTGDMSLLLGNLSRDETKRPLLEGDVQTKLSLLLEKRKEHYFSFPARIRLARTSSDNSIKTPAELAHEIMWLLNLVKGPRCAWKMLRCDSPIWQPGIFGDHDEMSGFERSGRCDC